jgi:hypothetical protein
MIKANELRIGNLVSFKNADYNVCRVQSIFITHFRAVNIENGVDYGDSLRTKYQPIPLTEEWLLKFGFQRNDNTKMSDSFYWIMIGGSELHINPDNGVVWIRRNENIFNNPCLVKNVHELQNLYYALTGVELSVS